MNDGVKDKYVVIELRIPLVVKSYISNSLPDVARNVEFHRQMDSSCTSNWFSCEIPELYQKLEEISNWSDGKIREFEEKYGEDSYHSLSYTHADITRHRFVRAATPQEIELGVVMDSSITREIDFDRRERIRNIADSEKISFSEAEKIVSMEEIIEQ